MAKLKSLSRNQELLSDLQVASRFWERGIGLLGRASLGEREGLWIHRCPSIHTWFMMFPIDCVFVDRDLKVKAVFENVKPWRVVFPVRGASSVIEMTAGAVKRLGIQVGENLHVVA
ncbi:MAG: DUF192 domain-containing protein [Bdellovibrionaceae bacterium]|nr:DUF192 domain-containing protein [Pseudobdellovibrionaceae bacterium]MBX3032726.1 DUF192 domain-containing protein [Pseudobdellovibrionaceae bacterium]